MNYIEEGVKRKLVNFDSEQRKQITFLHQNVKRNYTQPEIKVQTEAFLRLIIDYGYSEKRIKQFVPVTMGRDIKEADIIVYNDDECSQPYIVIECKKQDITDAEFNQAVNQAFSYAYALAGSIKYIWVTNEIKNAYYKVDKNSDEKETIPNIPKCGSNEILKYLYVKGGGKGDNGYFDLRTITEDELTKIFQAIHQLLWDGGKRDESEAFDEFDKVLFCKMWDERAARKTGEPYSFQFYKEDEPEEKLYKRIISIYGQGRRKDANVFSDDIKIDVQELSEIARYLQGINLSATDLDSKGKAFETFMGGLFRGKFGAFFTPRPVVKFIVDVLPIKNDSKVLDTSCGSGGFLLYALDKVRHLAKEYYEEGTIEHFRFWHDFAEKNLFGIEISNKISRTAKMNMIIHDDGHTNVIQSDGLVTEKDLRNKNKGFQYGTFDFIITNPPFGSEIKQTKNAYFSLYKVAHKQVDWLDMDGKETLRNAQSTEVMFIEQDYRFLREGGILAIVVPDGILTNSSLQYFRNQIEEWFRIVAVVSLPQTTFTATGAGVKSSVLFLKKWNLSQTDDIINKKGEIKQELLSSFEYEWKLKEWEKTKKELQKKKIEELKTILLVNSVAEVKKSEEYRKFNDKLNEDFAEKIASLKDDLRRKYIYEQKKRLLDYPIFMAIAEQIGYDATGKKIPQNDLIMISEELKKFIENLE
ncbi:MAG: N-6 DNA methylase [Bacteroidales bacterium]|nr:N-6 DNA methylase [Bacteroidales bacterium]